MANSRRRNIIDRVVSNLKLINGGVSTFDATYTYNINVSNNVFRNLKFFDEINDFPSVFVQAGRETRDYSTKGLTEALLNIIIRCYVHIEDPEPQIEDLFQDIEHVLENIANNPQNEIKDITITAISTDEGLLNPYGIGEILVNVFYELEG